MVARLHALLARMAAARGSRPALRDAQAAFQAHDAESVRIMAERKREYARLYEAYRVLEERRVNAIQAVRGVNDLLASHPDLLNGEEPANHADWS